jgi:hypothetical protein
VYELQAKITQAITTINSDKMGARKEHELFRCLKSTTYEGKHLNYLCFKRQGLTIIVSMGKGAPEVPSYNALGYSWVIMSPE